MILGDGFWCVFSLSQWALKKSLNFIFPIKYEIPKSLKFSHWPSKFFLSTQKIQLKKKLSGFCWVFPGTDLPNPLPAHYQPTQGHQLPGWFSCIWLFPKTFHTNFALLLALLVWGLHKIRSMTLRNHNLQTSRWLQPI